jgi:hypothetical protein
MKNFYQVLGLSQEASQRSVFRAFRKKYPSPLNNSARTQEVLTAYLVLSQNSRKYFDILQKQLEANKTPNKKYLKIISNQSAKADLILQNLSTKSDQIISVLKKSPFKEAALGLIGISLNINDSSFAWAFRLIFISIVLFVVIENSNILTYLTGLALLIFAAILLERGVVNSRKEKIDKIISDYS